MTSTEEKNWSSVSTVSPDPTAWNTSEDNVVVNVPSSSTSSILTPPPPPIQETSASPDGTEELTSSDVEQLKTFNYLSSLGDGFMALGITDPSLDSPPPATSALNVPIVSSSDLNAHASSNGQGYQQYGSQTGYSAAAQAGQNGYGNGGNYANGNNYNNNNGNYANNSSYDQQNNLYSNNSQTASSNNNSNNIPFIQQYGTSASSSTTFYNDRYSPTNGTSGNNASNNTSTNSNQNNNNSNSANAVSTTTPSPSSGIFYMAVPISGGGSVLQPVQIIQLANGQMATVLANGPNGTALPPTQQNGGNTVNGGLNGGGTSQSLLSGLSGSSGLGGLDSYGINPLDDMYGGQGAQGANGYGQDSNGMYVVDGSNSGLEQFGLGGNGMIGGGGGKKGKKAYDKYNGNGNGNSNKNARGGAIDMNAMNINMNMSSNDYAKGLSLGMNIGGVNYSNNSVLTPSDLQVDNSNLGDGNNIHALYGSTRRPALKDLLGNVRRLSKDQVGCRLLQQALDEDGSEASTAIFREGLPFMSDIMTDPFGNYLFQKILEKASDTERLTIIRTVAPKLFTAALNLHGTRSVQKVVEMCAFDSTSAQCVTKALAPQAARLCIDANGNHVIQRVLQRLPHQHARFVFDAVASSVGEVARHRHGCCVIQRCLDSPKSTARSNLVARIVEKALELMQDAYGNYVVQYVLDVCSDEEASAVCESVAGRVSMLAVQKFSSNVMEKCLEKANDGVQELYLRELASADKVRDLMSDPFGNYVIQRGLAVATHSQAVRLVEAMRPHLQGMRNTAGGRRIVAKICRRFPNFNAELSPQGENEMMEGGIGGSSSEEFNSEVSASGSGGGGSGSSGDLKNIGGVGVEGLNSILSPEPLLSQDEYRN